MNEEIAMVILPLASPRVPGVSRRGAKLCTSRRVLLGGAGADDYSTGERECLGDGLAEGDEQ